MNSQQKINLSVMDFFLKSSELLLKVKLKLVYLGLEI